MQNKPRTISLPVSTPAQTPIGRTKGGSARLWRDDAERNGAFAAGDAVHYEFADGCDQWPQDLSRRNFLKVAGASLAVAGVGGMACDYVPETKIVPYVNPPEQVVAGQPTFYATTMPLGGWGHGVLAESYEGRPTKIEGNPDHPASRGRTNLFMQASVLQLYDPQRAREVTLGGYSSTWDLFLSAIRSRLSARPDGSGVGILIGRVTSPTMLALIAELQHKYSNLRVYTHDPIDRTVRGPWPVYSIENAKVILSLDSDFLFEEPGSVHYAMKFAEGRRVRRDRTDMNRLYCVEGTYTLTGSMADHRKAVLPSKVLSIAGAIAKALGVLDADVNAPPPPAELQTWINTVAEDLKRNGKQALVIPGMNQPVEVHSLAAAINEGLGSTGTCVNYADIPTGPDASHAKFQLLADVRGKQIDTLLLVGGNPAYDFPTELNFAEELAKFSNQQGNLTAHLGLYNDETGYRCQWNLPESHYLEAWGDLRSFEGSASLVQPLILPMYPSKSAIELLDTLIGRARGGYEIVHSFWQTQPHTEPFDVWWEAALRKGVIDGTAAPLTNKPPAFMADYLPGDREKSADHPGAVEVIFRPDPTVYDGSFSTLGWLQECPKPFTKLTWDNAGLIAPALAARNGLRDGDMVRISLQGRTLDVGVMVLPGHVDNAMTLHLGYGRRNAGEVGGDESTARGFDAYSLRTMGAIATGSAVGASMTRIDGAYRFAVTRSHHAMDAVGDTYAKDAGTGVLKPEDVETPGSSDYDVEIHNRKLVRVADIAQYRDDLQAHPDDPSQMIRRLGGEAEEKKELLSLYPGWDYSKGMQWAMSIDLNSCIGCNACLVACVAENNIATVGKEQVILQREMHWIRIDDYFAGDEDDPRVFHEPVPCQHCENAPCEVVCPVGATTHSEDGINEMTYNRCVGTRYCSNNCPYKVRRFNFLLFSDETTESIQGQRNPDVTVRSRGVMEKCSYCVQRIRRTSIEMEKMQVQLEAQGRSGDVSVIQKQMLASLQTACQQACPTNAIVFGDKNDPGSEVSKLKREPLDYSLLTELTTVPRTTYLARLTNRNPDLTGEPA